MVFGVGGWVGRFYILLFVKGNGEMVEVTRSVTCSIFFKKVVKCGTPSDIPHGSQLGSNNRNMIRSPLWTPRTCSPTSQKRRSNTSARQTLEEVVSLRQIASIQLLYLHMSTHSILETHSCSPISKVDRDISRLLSYF